jgi:flagellar capping protein FliD
MTGESTSITFRGATVTSGTVLDVTPDGSSFSLLTPTSQTLTLEVPDFDLIHDLASGDAVQVTYTTDGKTLVARMVTITSTAAIGGDAATGTSSGY